MNRLILPCVLVFVTALYSGVLKNGFVWDDFLLFIDNASLRTGAITWQTLCRPVLDGTTYLRPLVLLSFSAEFRVWGVNAFAAHAVNLAIHLANTALVFLLAIRSFRAMGIRGAEVRAGLAAAAFGVHPAMLEATAWVSGRFDLMATMFVLAALVADVLVKNVYRKALVISLCFGLALGSKEVAVVLPPVLLLLRLMVARDNERSLFRNAFDILKADWPTVLGLGTIFAGYIALRMMSFDAVVHTQKSLADLPPYLHLLLVLETLAFYLAEIAAPFASFSPFHPLDVTALTQPLGLLKAALGASAILTVGVLLAGRLAAGFLLACAGLSLLPVLHIIPLTIGGNIGHDRFLTLPLAFIAVALMTFPALPERIARPRTLTIAASLFLSGWFALSATSIWVTVPLWRNELTFWNWTYHRHPDFEPAQTSFLTAAMRRQRFDLAEPVFDRLRSHGPLIERQQLLYGAFLTARSEFDEAEKYIKGVLAGYERDASGEKESGSKRVNVADEHRIFMAYAYSTLAKIAIAREDFAQALKDNRMAMTYASNAPYLLFQEGLVLLAINEVEAGEASIRVALDLTVAEQRPLILREKVDFLKTLCLSKAGASRRVCEAGYGELPRAGNVSHPSHATD